MQPSKKRKSAYQKLKEENASLKQDLYNIIKGDHLTSLQTYTQWKTIFDGEDLIMAGTHSPISKGDGIWGQIKAAR